MSDRRRPRRRARAEPAESEQDDHTAEVIASIHALREQGASKGAIREQLVQAGYSERDARAYVSSALDGEAGDGGGGGRRAPRARERERESGGSKAGGIVGMILFVVVFNVLSQVFDWGWVFW